MSNILSTRTNDAIFNASLSFLVALGEVEVDEEEEGQQPGVRMLARVKELPKALSHVLRYTTSPEVLESALELLRLASEDEILAAHVVGESECWNEEEGFFEALVSKVREALLICLGTKASLRRALFSCSCALFRFPPSAPGTLGLTCPITANLPRN